MPTNVVHGARDEHLWKKAKAVAEKEGRGGDYAYVMGIYKRMGGLEKSAGEVSHYLLSPLGPGRYSGQVPRLDPELERTLTERPPPWSEERHHARPVATASDTVRGLGLPAPVELNAEQAVKTAVSSARNLVDLRGRLQQQFIAEGMDRPRAQLVTGRAAELWLRGRGVQKSLVYTVDELLAAFGAERRGEKIRRIETRETELEKSKPKAQPRGGSYHRRVTGEDGKHRYYYDEKKYEADHGVHIDGESAAHEYVRSRFQKCVEKAGPGGCPIADVAPLVKRHGGKAVHAAAKSLVEEKRLRFQGGRFYAGGGTKPESRPRNEEGAK